MIAGTPLAVPPEAVLDVCLCHGSRRAARGLSRLYDAALTPLGLKAGQFNLLIAIAAAAPVTITRLSEIMLMEVSTLSRNLKPLRESGQVLSEGGSGRRAGHLSVTSAGFSILAAALPVWQDVQRQLTARLGSGVAGTLLQSLEAAAIASA